MRVLRHILVALVSAGQVMMLGAPDAQGRVYSFELRRLPAAPPFAPDELRGWRLTMLAGKRFAHVFEVAGNGGLENIAVECAAAAK